MQPAHHFSTYLRILFTSALCLLFSLGMLAADQFTVVIDAGHGGKDFGAIDNGVNEKDINLAVALKTGEMIKKRNKNVKVVYTRDKDEYLTLQQRADKANKAKGDLFISIHTNSVDKNNPNRSTVAGSSVYTLGLHKGDNNMAVARRENAVMTYESDFESKYSGFNPNEDESYIIFEMAQKANMNNSAKFANMVQKQLTQTAGRRDRGVHQAGFWVLWATSMPSILVELDFICNPTSAEYIASNEGQKKMAESISNATGNYFTALAQHSSKLMHAENETAEETSVTSFADAQQGVVLASTTPKAERQVAPSPASTTKQGNTSRRRRSEASRKKSENQVYAEAVIMEEGSYIVDAVDEPEPAIVEKTSPVKKTKDRKSNKKQKKAVKKTQQLASNDTPKVKKQAKEAKSTSGDKEKALKRANTISKKMNQDVQTASNTAKQEKGNVHARLAKKDKVYKIQLFASDELLTVGNEQFHGLTPVTCIPEKGIYKYVYGEASSRTEIDALLKDVKRLIPEAQVIEVRKSASARAAR